MTTWYKGPEGPWQPWFAVRPVQDIHGQWHWLRKIYRREKNKLVWRNPSYEFGTLFDYLRDYSNN